MADTLLISRQEIAEILSLKEVIDVVEQVYRAHGLDQVTMPAKVNLDLSSTGEDNWINAMPAYIPSLNAAGIKWAGGFAHNVRARTMEYLQGVIVLNDPLCGAALAVMDGAFITSLRTGASAAVAARWLSGSKTKAATIIGAGAQGMAASRALLQSCASLETLYVFDVLSESAERLREAVQPDFAARVVAASDLETAVRRSEVVVTLTTANAAIVARPWLKAGSLVLTMGSHQELDPEIVLRADLLAVDDISQCLHRGELAPLVSSGQIDESDIDLVIGDVVAGRAKGRIHDDQTVVVSLVGLGSIDIACAALVFRKRRECEDVRTFSFA